MILGIVFIWFLPEIITNFSSKISIFILFWIILFFLLEILLHRHHCKELQSDCEKNIHSYQHNSGFLMNISTFLHNFIHWIVIFSAFSFSLSLWWLTSFSIFLHSIPQNIANYLLSHKNKKLVYIAAIANIIWVFVLYPFKDFVLQNKVYFISLVMWWLLYIALSDILPEFRYWWGVIYKFIYFILVICGILFFYLFHFII